MTDDTTTWLKKNPVINPLRRSLKTSLRFHVNASEMDASIMSNPGKSKEQQIIVPRILQRPSVRMSRMLKGNEFKMPRNLTGKPDTKEQAPSGTSGDSKLPPSRKSLLPVKNRLESIEKIPGSVTRRNTSRHDLMQKMMAAVKNNQMNQEKAGTGEATTDAADGSIIRSILKKKKRNSLRRSLSTSEPRKTSRPVKKVLFEGFENVDEGEKENESIVYPTLVESDCDFAGLDEATAFFNFRNADQLESSPMERKGADVHETKEVEQVPREEETGLSGLLKHWTSYLAKFGQLKSLRDALRDSFRVHVEQSQRLEDQFRSYLKNCDDLYEEMFRMEKEVEESLRRVLSGGERRGESPREKVNSTEKRRRDRGPDKIGLSDKSRAIKKNSTKPNSALKSGMWRTQGNSEGFSLVETKGVLTR